jgi:hypothetical protein
MAHSLPASHPGSGQPGSGQHGMMQALGNFQSAAQAAAGFWGAGDLTVQQGLHITWMVGTISLKLRIVAAQLSRLEVTSPAASPQGTPGTTATPTSAPARPGDLEDHLAPNEHISRAAQHLGTAHALALRLPAVPPIAASPADGPAVAAARDMLGALDAATGTWTSLSGSGEDRDLIATEMLFAVNGFEAATLVLAQGGPPAIQESLRQVAHDLDSACIHLRESVACSLARQPEGSDLARQLREAFPVISEIGPAAPPGATASGPGSASTLAATAFPGTEAPTAPVGNQPRTRPASLGGPGRRPTPRRRNS